MTIKEVQELIAGVDAKAGAGARPAETFAPGTVDGVFADFLDAVRRANSSGADLTEVIVRYLSSM